MFKKIYNPTEYIKNFDIEKFIEGIELYPKTWSESRPGKDDKWGVDLILHSELEIDAYFEYYNLIYHENVGKLWSDFGYTSGSEQEKIINEKGMKIEWEKAITTKREIINTIKTKYSSTLHLKTLEMLYKLSDSALSELYLLYNVKEDIIICYDYITNSTVINFSRYRVNRTNINNIIELVQNGFLKNAKFSLCVKNLNGINKVVLDYEIMHYIINNDINCILF